MTRGDQTPQAALQDAMALYRQGRLAEAERVCAGILRGQPDHFDALHLLGVAALQTARFERGAELLRAAVAANPNSAAAHDNLGNALNALKRPDEAVRFHDRAIALRPGFAEAYNNRGNALKELLRFDDALASYAAAAALEPGYALAHYNRANTLMDMRRPEEALQGYDRAIALQPDYAHALCNRGNALKALQRADEALASYAAAIALDPNYALAYFNRGNVLSDLGRAGEALECYGQAAALRPGFAEAHCNRGNVLMALKRASEALSCYDSAIAVRPGYTEARCNRGNALKDLGRFDEALASYAAAIALDPGYALAHYNRGNLLNDLGRTEAALLCYETAVALKPDYAHAHGNRGVALMALGRPLQAIDSYGKAIALSPGDAKTYCNRANALMKLGRPQDALADYDKAIALNPGNAAGHQGRGDALSDLERIPEALASYDTALTLDPGGDHVASLRLNAKMWLCDWRDFAADCEDVIASVKSRAVRAAPFVFLTIPAPARDQAECAKLYAAGYPLAATPLWRGDRYGHERIRVAYLSADFRVHATAHLITELIERHDRSRFEIVGVSFGPDDRSGSRKRLAAAFDAFHDVRSRNDREIATLVRGLEADIAVDLKGYTQHSRPGIFGYRPAPVQASYLGYPGTLGTAAMDYIIADPIVIPSGHEPFYTEKIVRLPDCYQVNDGKRPIAAQTPGRREMGLPGDGFVFCCFNNGYKITPPLFDVWMRILGRTGGSVLWLLENNAAAAANLKREAAARHIDPERLIFAPRLPLPEHLARYRLAGLFLDTLPYNAHTTASDALWAGVPVLTLIGETFAGRVGASLLNAIGLPGLVTTTPEDYERLAVALAASPGRLAALKRELAANRLTAPLFDTPRFTRTLEAAYAVMRDRSRRGLPPESFAVPGP